MIFRLFAATVILASVPPFAFAQIDRYELGRRLREFERAWDKADAAGRKRSVEPLKSAVNSFFTFSLRDTGRNLDRARFSLNAKESAEGIWATSLFVKPATRFTDADELPFVVDAFYKVPLPPGAEARLEAALITVDGTERASTAQAIGALPAEGSLRIEKLPEGDYQLEWRVFLGKERAAAGRVTLSRVARGKARLEALQKAIAGWDRPRDDVDRASVRALAATLNELWAKKTLETDYPAAALLSEAEAVVKQAAANETYYSSERPGTFWLSVPDVRSNHPIRLFVPESGAKGDAVPLVVALHGAGGSENMFFDTYGDGAIVRLCKERGWMLVTTRSGLLGGTPPVAAIVDTFSLQYKFEPKRVFLIGHSLGAAQAADIVGQSPGRFAGVALLGGGGRVKKSDALKAVPFFVAAGGDDFGLGMAKSLHAALRKADVKQATFREYADVEHLVIVQAALGDVFAFYDGIAKEKK